MRLLGRVTTSGRARSGRVHATSHRRRAAHVTALQAREDEHPAGAVEQPRGADRAAQPVTSRAGFVSGMSILVRVSLINYAFMSSPLYVERARPAAATRSVAERLPATIPLRATARPNSRDGSLTDTLNHPLPRGRIGCFDRRPPRTTQAIFQAATPTRNETVKWWPATSLKPRAPLLPVYTDALGGGRRE